MPELPEVETVRRGLVPYLAGQCIVDVSITDQRLVQPERVEAVEALLRGRRIIELGRRGKYLIFELDDEFSAVHHLRMTGSFVAGAALHDGPSHVRMRYVLGHDETRSTHDVVYRDPRRFGTLLVAPTRIVTAYLDARLGPEPLEEAFTARVLRRALSHRSAPLKAALLDQRIVAGLGNIYVDEACFLAGVRPDAIAQRVGPAALERLVTAIKQRLAEAIEAGGSTLRDYRGVEGSVGEMQERFVAYGRAGLPCVECGRTMRGTRIAGRSTSYCTHCQRLPRR